VLDVQPGAPSALPKIVSNGQNRGFWAHSRHLWWQNEDTAHLPDLVDRRSFNELLKDFEPRAKSPEGSLKSIKLRPGYQAELVAFEPLTMDPVSLDWDEHGRLWVVEMADYPLGEDGKGKPCGRIRVLEDTDNDGKYDKSTIFLDGLSYPNGIMCWRNGVLVSCAPDIFYAEDTDGDGKCDKREVLFTGFDLSNPQHRVNGFSLGLDGWVHAADAECRNGVKSLKTGNSLTIRGSDIRFKPDTGDIEPTSGRGQFGRTRDDWGNWFSNDNSTWARHEVIGNESLRRNRSLAIPTTLQLLDPDRRLFPVSPILARFNDLDNAGLATSACSPAPYRDDLFGPWFENNLFVCEPVHNLVHRVVLKPDGVTYKGERAPGEEQGEFLASSDNYSRFVQVKTGPDGALWIADMYRAVIEHPEWIPDDWEAKIDLRAGQDKGRIYRVFPIGTKPRPIEKLAGLDTSGLVAAMDTPNGPQRDSVMRLLLHRNDKSAEEQLSKLASRAARPAVRLQALATLSALGVLNDSALANALADTHPEVRRFGATFAGSSAHQSRPVAEGLIMAATDPHSRVRMGAALGLADWVDPLAGKTLADLIRGNADDPWLRTAALTSAPKHAAALMTRLLLDTGGDGPPEPVLNALLPLVFDEQKERAAHVRLMMEAITRPGSDTTQTSQFKGLAALLDAASRRQLSFDALVGMFPEPERAPVRERIQTLVSAARVLASNQAAPSSGRIVALRLLSRPELRDDESVKTLHSLIASSANPEIQSAAMEALFAIDADRAVTAVLDGWKGYGPSFRARVLITIATHPDGLSKLLDAVEADRVSPAEITSSLRQALLTHRDAKIKDRAIRLFVPLGARSEVLDRYKTALASIGEGESRAGRLTYEKNCAVCHQLQGIGTEVGPNLAALTDRSPTALLTAILDPNRAFEAQYTEYAVALKDGRALSGMIAAETANSITLRGQEGKEEVLLRSDIEDLASAGRSFMPEGLEKDLTERDLANLIAFLSATSNPPKAFDGNRPSVMLAGDDGTIRLPATAAEIYGSSLVFEPQYENLGYWSSPDDRAAWSFEAPEAGVYDIFTDYAAASDVSGNHFDVRVGMQSVEGVATSTGTWDHYRRKQRVGELKLQKGRNRLEVVPHGEIRGALMDLRAVILSPRPPSR
jgi:putative membrane-bound dehydrogenase-like protein